MAERSALYFGRLDGSLEPRPLTTGVCYCCKTSLAAGVDGSLYAAWRHVYPGNIRDIAFTSSRDGGRTFAAPVRVSEDKWVLDGCPENGPAVAADRSGRVHVVWPTLVDGSTGLALFYARSIDGRRFTPRQRIPTEGTPRHPQMAVAADGSFVVVWDEGESGARRIAATRGGGASAATLDVRFVREPLESTTAATYPVVASVGTRFVLAWASRTSTSAIHVRPLP